MDSCSSDSDESVQKADQRLQLALSGSLMALCVVEEEVKYRLQLLFLLISDAPIWGGNERG